MITANIQLGKNVYIEKDASVNNVRIGDFTKIAGGAKIFGSPQFILEVGSGSYIAANAIIEGYNAKVIIGKFVSFGQLSHLMSGSGPHASDAMLKIFPVVKGEVTIGDHSWIGASSIIMPNVSLGKYCVVAANSFVNNSFSDYSIIGGTPAKLIRTLTPSEIEKLHSDD